MKKIAIMIATIFVILLFLHFIPIVTEYKETQLEIESAQIETTAIEMGEYNFEDDKRYVLVDEHENMQMYFDINTSNIIVTNNGEVAFETIPYVDDASVTNSIIKSPLVVSYNTGQSSSSFQMNAYDDCIVKNSYTAGKITDGGVEVVYTLGSNNMSIDMLPLYMSSDEYDAVVANISAESADTLGNYYTWVEDMDAYQREFSMKPSKIEAVYEILYLEGGYTVDQLNASNEKYDVAVEEVAETPSFVIPVRYSFDENGNFSVIVDANNIVTTGVTALNTISIMPGFMKSQDGYFLIPDGSGAVIDLSAPIQGTLYSKPFAPINEDALGEVQTTPEEYLSLPAFANENIVAIVESGAESMTLEVNLNNGQYLMYPQITYSYNQIQELEGGGLKLFSEPQTGLYEVTYMISEEEKTYYEQIKTVSDYYAQKFALTTQEVAPTLTLEFIGTYNYTNYFLGVPYMDFQSATTYEQATEIAAQFAEANILYVGWSENGIVDNSNDLDNSKENGSQSELETFVSTTGASMSLNLIEYNSEINGDFQVKYDGTENIKENPVVHYPPQNSTNTKDKDGAATYMLNPKYLIESVKSKEDDIEGFEEIYLTDVGDVGYAEITTSGGTTPMEAEYAIETSLEYLSEIGKVLTIQNPILERGFYSDYITDLPTSSSKEQIFTYDVPFTQLVYYGLIPYSTVSVNLSNTGNVEYEVMKALEYQADVKFTLSNSSSSQFKGTDYDYLYATGYDQWGSVVKEVEAQMNAFYEEIQNGQIINHETIAPNVVKVTYDTGCHAVFNYGVNDFTYNGQVVSSGSYKVMEGN